MSNLFCSEEEFQRDVEALQAEYEAKAKALQASMDDEQRWEWSGLEPRRAKRMPTATAPGARGDSFWNPAAVKCLTNDFEAARSTRKATAFVPPRIWSI